MICSIDERMKRIARGEGDDAEEAIFAHPPPPEDCPICFLPLPGNQSVSYQACCGKLICFGCCYGFIGARTSMGQEERRSNVPNPTRCPFCNKLPSGRKIMKRLEKRVKANDPNAMYQLACAYYDGEMGVTKFNVEHPCRSTSQGKMRVTKDAAKAIQLWHRASELGSINAHHELAHAYLFGEGVTKDRKKATYHLRIAAMCGHLRARYILGILEMKAGKKDPAIRHLMISAMCGCDDSLQEIRFGYKCGDITKDEFERALRAHNDANDESRSKLRDKVEASSGKDYLPGARRLVPHAPSTMASTFYSSFILIFFSYFVYLLIEGAMRDEVDG